MALTVTVPQPHAPFSSPSNPSSTSSICRSRSTAINFDLATCFRHMGLYSFRFRASFRRRNPILNAASSSAGAVELGFREIQEKCCKWQWNGHSITYLVLHPPQPRSSNPPLLLVHGFGASIAHWRRFLFLIAFSPFNLLATCCCCTSLMVFFLFFSPNLFTAPNVYLLFVSRKI